MLVKLALLTAFSMSHLSAIELPNVLGTPPSQTKEEWVKTGRPQTLELFRKHIFGRAPIGKPDTLAFKVIEEDPTAMGGPPP